MKLRQGYLSCRIGTLRIRNMAGSRGPEALEVPGGFVGRIEANGSSQSIKGMPSGPVSSTTDAFCPSTGLPSLGFLFRRTNEAGS